MRKTLLLIACTLACSLLMSGHSFAQAKKDCITHPECTFCGMNRKGFERSRLHLEHRRGKAVGVCSVFCAAKDYVRNIDDPPVSMQVGDYNSGKLIDAVKAYWVMGGSKAGVMTNRAKWAFEKKKDALAFIKRYGGEPIDFDTAMKASFEDMYEDMRVLKEMRLEHTRKRASRSISSHRKN